MWKFVEFRSCHPYYLISVISVFYGSMPFRNLTILEIDFWSPIFVCFSPKCKELFSKEDDLHVFIYSEVSYSFPIRIFPDFSTWSFAFISYFSCCLIMIIVIVKFATILFETTCKGEKKSFLYFILTYLALWQVKQELYLLTVGFVLVCFGRDRDEHLVKDYFIYSQCLAFQVILNLILEFEVVITFY